VLLDTTLGLVHQVLEAAVVEVGDREGHSYSSAGIV
jgi:hypothetical protein